MNKNFVRHFTLGRCGRFELPVAARPISEDLQNARSTWPWGNYTIIGNTKQPASTPVFTGEDRIVHCISQNQEVSVLSVSASDVVREAQRRFRTGRSGTSVLGQGLMGALLLDVIEASSQSVELRIIGTGSIGCVTVICSGSGVVKGCLDFPRSDFPLLRNGMVDMRGTLGDRCALLTTLRSPAWKRHKLRSVKFEKGDIAKGIESYLGEARSKVLSFASFGVSFNWQGYVTGARGYIYQAVHGVSKDNLNVMDMNMRSLPSLASDIPGFDACRICETLLQGFTVGDIQYLPSPRFGPCGLEMKQRVLESEIAKKGFWQIRQELQLKGYVEAFCDACGEEYRYVEHELGELVGESISDSEEEC